MKSHPHPQPFSLKGEGGRSLPLEGEGALQATWEGVGLRFS
jgi:hypothetical protein